MAIPFPLLMSCKSCLHLSSGSNKYCTTHLLFGGNVRSLSSSRLSGGTLFICSFTGFVGPDMLSLLSIPIVLVLWSLNIEVGTQSRGRLVEVVK